LIADGEHAKADGLTSLAVLFGTLGVLAGAPIADPIIGLGITFAILFIVKDAGLAVWRRLLDAVDPEVLRAIEKAAAEAIDALPAARGIDDLRVRWLGHRLQAELSLIVDENVSTRESHEYAEEVRHALYHARPELSSIIIHTEPDGSGGTDPHEITAHHRPASRRDPT
jgi:cation diffusion facilitator family transporter